MTLRDQILANIPASIPRLAHLTGAPILQVEATVATMVREGVLYRLGGMFHRCEGERPLEPIKVTQRRSGPWRCAVCHTDDESRRSPNKRCLCRECRNEQVRASVAKQRAKRAHQTRVLRDTVALLEARVQELEARYERGGEGRSEIPAQAEAGPSVDFLATRLAQGKAQALAASVSGSA